MIHFDIFKLERELSNLESDTSNPDFWNDNKKSSVVLKKITNLKSKLENVS